jgi:flagellar basal-body rod modification protein FlgD
VNTLAAASAASSSADTSALKRPTQQFGQEQFLTMMLAQLKNQDPLKPLEPSEFLGQLAQFSTVTGVQEMQKSLGTMVDSLRSSQAIEGANFVGRQVLAPGSTAVFDGGSAVQGAVDMPAGTAAAELIIRDAAGAVVRTAPLDPRAGLTGFAWDGRNNAGNAVAPGAYKIEVAARRGDRTEALETMLQSRVDSVTLDTGGAGLMLNTLNGTLPISAVRRVM